MKVGDYVRLDRCQGINKIIAYYEDTNLYELEDVINDEWGEETWYLDKNDVIKSSPNIIDLIEINDFVNQEEVILIQKIRDFSTMEEYKEIVFRSGYKIRQEDIKSIVTKESMESVTYYVK